MLPFVAGAAAVALTAGACGSGNDAQVSTDDQSVDDGAPAAPEADTASFRQAVEETSDASTATYTMDMTMDAPVFGEVTMAMTGAYDTDAGLVAMTVDMSGFADAMGGMGGSAEMSDDMTAMFNTPIEMVVDGRTAYIHSDAFAEIAGADTPWISIEVPEDQDPTELFGGNDLFSAAGLLEQLAAEGVEMAEQGTEEIDGVSTTHYAGSAPMADLMGSLGDQLAGELPEGAESDDLDEMMEGVLGDVEGEMTIDAWIDADGLLRRAEMDMSLMGMMSISYVLELSDVGEPVDIARPDPAEVTAVDIDSLSGFGLGMGD